MRSIPLSERVARGNITSWRAHKALDVQEREQRLANQATLFRVCLAGLFILVLLFAFLIVSGRLELEASKELLLPITDFFIRQLSNSAK